MHRFSQLATQSEATAAEHAARFLGSQNPALMKRNVLASFANILLLPVTIVPRTVNALVTTGSTAAVNGIAMLNPQRWGAQAASGYSTDFNGKTNELLFDSADQNEEKEEEKEKQRGWHGLLSLKLSWNLLFDSLDLFSCNTRRTVINNGNDCFKPFNFPSVII
jgi:hypothetical protein